MSLNKKLDNFLSNVLNKSIYSEEQKGKLFELADIIFNQKDADFHGANYKSQTGAKELILFYGTLRITPGSREVNLELFFQEDVNLPLIVSLVNHKPDEQVISPHYSQNQNVQKCLIELPNQKPIPELLAQLRTKFSQVFPYEPNPIYHLMSDQAIYILKSYAAEVGRLLQQDIESQRMVNNQLCKLFIGLKQKEAELKRLRYEIEETNNELLYADQQMDYLYEDKKLEAEKVEIDKVVLVEEDYKQVTELQVTLKVTREAYKFIQHKFLNSNANLEWLVKNTRRQAENEFDTQLLVQKCLRQLQSKK